MKKLLLTIAMSTMAASLWAQTYSTHQQIFKLHRKANIDNTIDIICNKTQPGSYTILITFDNVENATIESKQKSVAVTGMGPISVLKIHPTSNQRSPSFWYSYSIINGILDPVFDSTLLYRIPLAAGREVQSADNSGKNGYVMFGCKPNEDIFAPRKGLIYSIKNNPRTKDLVVTIENQDHTYTTVSGIKPGSMGLLKVGDMVYADTKLGQAGSTAILVAVSYKGIDHSRAKDRIFSKTYFVNPFFATEQGAKQIAQGSRYTVTAGNALVNQEMSKRDVNRREKSKKEAQKEFEKELKKR